MRALILPLLAVIASEPVSALTLSEYLEQVKSQNPGAKAAVETVATMKLRLNEADGQFSPEFYSEYHLFDDRSEPTNPLSPIETRGHKWRVGVRDQTMFGLQADAYFGSTRTNLLGVSPQFFKTPDYEQSTMGVQFTQSLWRNSFGASSRADLEAGRAKSRMKLLKSEFDLKNILLGAENTYWALVSSNEIIKLQTDNVERARKLRDHMNQRARLRLYEDVDAMQTEASFQQRELELQQSTNDRAATIRQFNTLRGSTGETVEGLDDLPKSEMMLKQAKDPSKRMSREDFRMIYEQATEMDETAKSAISTLYPKLDLVGGIASHGYDANTPPSLQEAEAGRHPDWNIGLVFSVPLDYRLIGNMKHSFQSQARAAQSVKAQAKFDEERAWDDLLKKNREAQDYFDRSIKLEKLMTDLVKAERRLQLNGRSTTLQTVTVEKNLADSQILRVRAQLSLLQILNIMKQFEEQP